MKRLIIILSGFLILSSCNKDFLERAPQTDITDKAFFNNPTDLETYTNGFYSQLSPVYDDIGSDNISTYLASSTSYNMLYGKITPATIGGWNDWENLRTINYFLDNAGKATGDASQINHYIGIAKFYRALFYFNKLKRYSDVPWYSHALESGDPQLYKACDPRSVVADSILNDLEYAVKNILPAMGDRTRISKWTALTLMTRFCLFEGTFRKYHAEVELSGDYTRFLQRAVSAAEDVMGSGNFLITGTNSTGFRALFCSASLSDNKEMIMWKNCNEKDGVANNTHTVFDYQWGLSRSLQESYLMKDGTPFTNQPGYATKTFTEVFVNRDPRLAETICYPGFSTSNDPAKPTFSSPNLGGYDQLKFYPRDPGQRKGWVLNYTSLPIYRYAEVLLSYAEAKAELGTIDQTSLDNSVNLLRDRVQMPHMNLATANANIDPVLAAQYPNVSGANKGALLEIRRERRVEMACEGLRYDDLMRWYAGKCLQQAPQGMYVPALGAMDVTGDGVQDIAILASPSDTAPIDGLPPNVKNNLAIFYLVDADGKPGPIYLTSGTSGYIAFKVDVDNTRNFIEPQYYYYPIPKDQFVLNPKLRQPYGWTN